MHMAGPAEKLIAYLGSSEANEADLGQQRAEPRIAPHRDFGDEGLLKRAARQSRSACARTVESNLHAQG